MELNSSKSLHIDSSKIVRRYFLEEQEELTNGEMPYLPLSDKIGESLLKTLRLRSNELKLVYFSMARISRFLSINQQEVTRVYPLFSYNAEVFLQNSNYFLKIDRDSRDFIKGNLPSAVNGDLRFQYLMNQSEVVDLHFCMNFQEIVLSNTEDALTDELLLFPELWSKKKVNANLKKPFLKGDTYIPCGIVALVEKEFNAFNALGELDILRKSSSFSAPMEVLFNGKANHSTEKLGIICEELNRTQFSAIQNSNNHVASVISGPPGTGKSFTIANLTAEKVSKGASVLITSKNKEALDVIEEKIQEQIGIDNLCVNPSSDGSTYFYGMSTYLDFILGRKFRKLGYSEEEIDHAFERYQEIYDLHHSYEETLKILFERERDYYAALQTRKFTGSVQPTFQRKIMAHRSQQAIPLREELEKYYTGMSHLRSQAAGVIKMVAQFMVERGINQKRSALRHYQSFLKSRNLARKKKLLQQVDYEAVLTTFPVWLVRAGDVSRVLPLQKEVFDLLIVDEASQCDIPSLLPLIQRAKKVVVVGDNKQLAHISFVSKDFEEGCRADVKPDYYHLCRHRDYSLLDLAEEHIDPLAKTQLNEHFRSQFPIISFSNHAFYNRELDILTKRPIAIADHVSFIQTNGERSHEHNEKEAAAIIQRIQEIISHERQLPPSLKTSIGILSPFRKQVDYLLKRVMESFTINVINYHKIMIGTAFSFQGNERDCMMLSLALDNEAHPGSFNYMNRPDVFNVSITRAKDQQLIFYSFDPKKLKHSSTVARFFQHYQHELKNDMGKSTKDVFCVEVVNYLNSLGFQTWTNFSISGVNLDILVRIRENYLGIDLIGFPGEQEDYYSLERYKMIERGNIRLFPLSYPHWVGNAERCKKNLIELIEELKKLEDMTEEEAVIEGEVVIEEELAAEDLSRILTPERALKNKTFRILEKTFDADEFNLEIVNGKKSIVKLAIDCSDLTTWSLLTFEIKHGYKNIGLQAWIFDELEPIILKKGKPQRLLTVNIDLSKPDIRHFRRAGLRVETTE